MEIRQVPKQDSFSFETILGSNNIRLTVNCSVSYIRNAYAVRPVVTVSHYGLDGVGDAMSILLANAHSECQRRLADYGADQGHGRQGTLALKDRSDEEELADAA